MGPVGPGYTPLSCNRSASGSAANPEAAGISRSECQVEALTAKIGARLADKAKAIAAAKMPIEGLTLDDDQVLFNGLPFAQASDAEQLRVSVAIAMALNPKLRVVRIRDGSLLDEDALALLAQMADEKDVQVWIERVDSSGKVGFVLEDGHVRQAGGTDRPG